MTDFTKILKESVTRLSTMEAVKSITEVSSGFYAVSLYYPILTSNFQAVELSGCGALDGLHIVKNYNGKDFQITASAGLTVTNGLARVTFNFGVGTVPEIERTNRNTLEFKSRMPFIGLLLPYVEKDNDDTLGTTNVTGTIILVTRSADTLNGNERAEQISPTQKTISNSLLRSLRQSGLVVSQSRWAVTVTKDTPALFDLKDIDLLYIDFDLKVLTKNC